MANQEVRVAFNELKMVMVVGDENTQTIPSKLMTACRSLLGDGRLIRNADTEAGAPVWRWVREAGKVG